MGRKPRLRRRRASWARRREIRRLTETLIMPRSAAAADPALHRGGAVQSAPTARAGGARYASPEPPASRNRCVNIYSQKHLEGFVIPPRTQRRLTGTGQQPRDGRLPRRKPMPESRTDLAESAAVDPGGPEAPAGAGGRACAMFRAVNASLDPERVGEELVSQMADWLPMPAWVAPDGRRHRARPGARHGRPDAPRPSMRRRSSARW